VFVFGADEINLKKSTSSPAAAQPFQLTVMTNRSNRGGGGGGVGTGVLWELLQVDGDEGWGRTSARRWEWRRTHGWHGFGVWVRGSVWVSGSLSLCEWTMEAHARVKE
jgi:hypothetical protein